MADSINAALVVAQTPEIARQQAAVVNRIAAANAETRAAMDRYDEQSDETVAPVSMLGTYVDVRA